MSHADSSAPRGLQLARTLVKSRGRHGLSQPFAIAAPAAAASCSSPVSAIGCGKACKNTANGSGRRIYHFVFCFNNTFYTAVTVAADDVSVGGVPREAMLNCQPPDSGPAGCLTFVVPAGGTHCNHIDAGRSPLKRWGPPRSHGAIVTPPPGKVSRARLSARVSPFEKNSPSSPGTGTPPSRGLHRTPTPSRAQPARRLSLSSAAPARC